VWYKITGNGNTMTVTTCDVYTDFDTKVTVFANTCDSLVCVAALDIFATKACSKRSN